MIAQLRFPSWKYLQQTIPAFTVLNHNPACTYYMRSANERNRLHCISFEIISDLQSAQLPPIIESGKLNLPFVKANYILLQDELPYPVIV